MPEKLSEVIPGVREKGGKIIKIKRKKKRKRKERKIERKQFNFLSLPYKYTSTRVRLLRPALFTDENRRERSE